MKITDLQEKIMEFISIWVREKKTPVPRKMIFKHIIGQGAKEFTTDHAISSLVKKGYIRKAAVITRTTSYVQLRNLEWR